MKHYKKENQTESDQSMKNEKEKKGEGCIYITPVYKIKFKN